MFFNFLNGTNNYNTTVPYLPLGKPLDPAYQSPPQVRYFKIEIRIFVMSCCYDSSSPLSFLHEIKAWIPFETYLPWKLTNWDKKTMQQSIILWNIQDNLEYLRNIFPTMQLPEDLDSQTSRPRLGIAWSHISTQLQAILRLLEWSHRQLPALLAGRIAIQSSDRPTCALVDRYSSNI